MLAHNCMLKHNLFASLNTKIYKHTLYIIYIYLNLFKIYFPFIVICLLHICFDIDTIIKPKKKSN